MSVTVIPPGRGEIVGVLGRVRGAVSGAVGQLPGDRLLAVMDHRVGDPAAPAQFNSAYMLVYFIGGTLGTAFGAAAVEWFGWPTTTAFAAGAIVLALIVTATARTQTRSLG